MATTATGSAHAHQSTGLPSSNAHVTDPPNQGPALTWEQMHAANTAPRGSNQPAPFPNLGPNPYHESTTSTSSTTSSSAPPIPLMNSCDTDLANGLVAYNTGICPVNNDDAVEDSSAADDDPDDEVFNLNTQPTPKPKAKSKGSAKSKAKGKAKGSAKPPATQVSTVEDEEDDLFADSMDVEFEAFEKAALCNEKTILHMLFWMKTHLYSFYIRAMRSHATSICSR